MMLIDTNKLFYVILPESKNGSLFHEISVLFVVTFQIPNLTSMLQRSRKLNDDVFPGTKIALFYRNPVVISSPHRFNFGVVKREAAKKNVAWWWEFLRSLFKTNIGNLFRLFLKQKSGYMKFRFFRRQNPARFYRWRCQESPKTAPEHRALDRGDQFVPWSWTIFRKGFEGWFLKVYFVN